MEEVNKTKIEWTDFVWNPIKGLCPNDCWYCYARKIYERFGWETELSWDGRVPLFSNKKPSRIFVCSTMEMFHPQVPKEWRDRIFQVIEADYNKKHTFQILTKFPQNVDRLMPDNAWLGISVTSVEDDWRIRGLYRILDENSFKFISFEPLFEDLTSSEYWLIGDVFDWIIIGRLTQYGHKYDPKKEWIEYLVNKAKQNKTPIFLKNNLKPIWGENLIQEFPDETNT